MRSWASALAACVVLAACSSSPPAPVEERYTGPARGQSAPAEYRVRRGDTLFAIAFGYGLDYRDVARWNGIRAPYVIYPDQVLTLRPGTTAPPPPPNAGTVRTRPAAGPGPATTRQATTRPAETAPQAAPAAAPSQPVAAAERTPEPVAEPAGEPAPRPAPGPAVASADLEPGAWRWPVEGGRLLRRFSASDPTRKGLDIAGREGQAVHAAAPGTVVYSGSGLIGYGELIIVKHSDSLLSAYAHNRRRLVDEGEPVTAGQRIAELGRNDRNEAVLHFEVRVDGKPVDPLSYVPRP